MEKYWVYRGIYHEHNFEQPGFYKKSKIVSADLIILHGSYRIHDFTVAHRKR